MKFSELSDTEYPAYAQLYMKFDGDINLLEELEISLHRFIHFVREIPMDKFDFRYAPGKWTIKEIIQHLIDCERIFAYRAMAFARKDKTPLPGFDENFYNDQALGNRRHLNDLLTELSELRHTNLRMFKSFTPEMMVEIGTANHSQYSVRAIGFALIGHQNHHERIFKERYLSVPSDFEAKIE